MADRTEIVGNVLKMPVEALDFHHADSGVIGSAQTALDVYRAMASYNPLFLRVAFRVRDALCRLVGIAAIGSFSKRELPATVKAGDRLDFFDVYSAQGDELVLFADDPGLTVVVVLRLTTQSGEPRKFSIATRVKTKKLMGKIYMIPVGFAHRFIAKRMINSIKFA